MPEYRRRYEKRLRGQEIRLHPYEELTIRDCLGGKVEMKEHCSVKLSDAAGWLTVQVGDVLLQISTALGEITVRNLRGQAALF